MTNRRRSQTVKGLSLSAFVGVLLALPLTSQSAPRSRLQLIERTALSLPWRPAGVSAAGGAVFVWSAEFPMVYVYDGGTVDSVFHGDLLNPLALAPVRAGQELRILRGDATSWVTLSRSGALLGRVPIRGVSALARFQAAIATSSGWGVLGRDSIGVNRLFQVAHNGRSHEVIRGGFEGIPPAGLAFMGGEFVLLGWPSPFEAVWISGGRLSAPFRLVPDSALREFERQGPQDGLWIPVTVVALDGGFLMTFADLRSNRRLLVTSGARLTFRRATLIDGRLAFVASDPGSQRLWAVRALDVPELVSYEWRWCP